MSRQAPPLDAPGNARASSSRSRRFMQNLLLVLCSILFGLVCLEVGVRLLAHIRRTPTLQDLERHKSRAKGRKAQLGDLVKLSDNPLLMFEMIPGLDVEFMDVRVRINSDGFRDDEFPVTRKPGIVRIAAVGDSGTFGWRVDEKDRWSDALESVLDSVSTGTDFEVVNFSVPGYNTVMEREMILRDVLPLKPDILILQFDPNDMDLPNFVRQHENLLSVRKLFLPEFVRSRLEARRKSRLQAVPGMGALADVPTVPNGRFGMDERSIPDELRPLVGVANCTGAIADIGRICSDHAMPALMFLNAEDFSQYRPGHTARDDGFYAPYVSAAESAGFTVVDPSTNVMEFVKKHDLRTRDLWVYPAMYDSHAAPPRHTLIALSLAQELVRMPLVRERTRPAAADEMAGICMRKAEEQWRRMLEAVPRASAGAVSISLTADSPNLESGWYPPETDAGGESFRWCNYKANIKLPSCRRIIMETGAIRPPHLGPDSQKFTIAGEKLRYSVIQRRDRAWFDIPVPEKQHMTNKTLSIRTSKHPKDPADPKGPVVGLQVYSITIE